MKFYVTMGQNHIHYVNDLRIDKDYVIVINAANEDEARKKTFYIFKDKWVFIYTEIRRKKDNMIKYYYRGCFDLEVEVTIGEQNEK